jgi:hypothetical protein
MQCSRCKDATPEHGFDCTYKVGDEDLCPTCLWEDLLALRDRVAELEKERDSFDKQAADRLAYACAGAVMQRAVGSRSAIGDALLDYLQIGGMDGPQTTPEWMERYEAAARAATKRWD